MEEELILLQWDELVKKGLTPEYAEENLKDGELLKAAKSLLSNNDGAWPKAIPIKHRDNVPTKEIDRVAYIGALLLLEINRLSKKEEIKW